MADGFQHTFTWPHAEPQHVVVTGTFDNWSSSVTLQRDADNTFSATVALPYGSTVLYKYVVDGVWQTYHGQPTQDDGHNNVNNIFQVPEKPTATAPAEQSEHLPESDSLPAALSVAASAAVAGAGVAFAATSQLFSSAIGAASSALTSDPVAAPVETASRELPVNGVDSTPAVDAGTLEKPSEPAPSPAHLHDSKSQQSLPTVPSSQDLQTAVDRNPTPTAQTTSEPALPAVALAPAGDAQAAHQAEPKGTAVAAAGPDAAAATGADDGKGFLRLTEATGAAAVVGAGAAGVAAASKGKHTEQATTSSSSSALPPPIAGSDKLSLAPVAGVEVYKPDGSVGQHAKIEVAKAETESRSVPAETATGPAAAAAAATAPASTAAGPTSTAAAADPATAAAATTGAKRETPKSSKEPVKSADDVFSAAATPIKAATTGKANGKSYGGLTKDKEPSTTTAAPPTAKAATVGKASGATPAKAAGPDTPATPAKDSYTTAPSTPQTPVDGKKHEGRPRTTSFFSKVKSALSPSKSKK